MRASPAGADDVVCGVMVTIRCAHMSCVAPGERGGAAGQGEQKWHPKRPKRLNRSGENGCHGGAVCSDHEGRMAVAQHARLAGAEN